MRSFRKQTSASATTDTARAAERPSGYYDPDGPVNLIRRLLMRSDGRRPVCLG